MIGNGGIAYSSLYSTLDVVPLAWAQDDLETIPALYDANITPVKGGVPSDLFMGVLASTLQLNALAATLFGKIPYNPYTQISTGRAAITGTFDTTVDTAIANQLENVSLVLPATLQQYAPYLTNVARFVAQAVTQHTASYQGLPGIDIGGFNTEYQSILVSNPPPNATKGDITMAAVKKVTGLDLSSIDPRALVEAGAVKR